MEYYPAIKRSETMPFAATRMELESVVLSRPDSRKNIIYIPYWSMSQWNKAFSSNMEGCGDDHTKWRKSDREGQIAYDIT